MEHFIDNLSKQLARAVSRRDILRISTRGVFAAFVGSTPLAKMWASNTFTSSSATATSTVIITGSMEGNLPINPGDTVRAGYDFMMPGSHPAATIAVTNAMVKMSIICPDGSTQTLTVSLPDQSYSVLANDRSWLPSGEQNSSLVYQGSTTAPSTLCGGHTGYAQQGATFTANFESTDSSDALNVRFHYSDNSAGGWSATVSARPCVMCTRQGCGLPCPSVTFANLSQEAQQFSPYVALQNFLSGYFAGAQTQALVTQNPQNSFQAVLGTAYTASDPTVTATLFFVVSGSDPSFAKNGSNLAAFALQLKNGVPQVGYMVDADGQVEQLSLLPPSTASTVTQTVLRDVSFISASQQPTAACGPSKTCQDFAETICPFLTAGQEFLSSLATVAECAETTAGFAVFGFVVEVAAVLTCTVFVHELELPGGDCISGLETLCTTCPPLCCGLTCPRLICVDGTCVEAVACPDGFSCNSGMCTCDNLCGITCCSSGETCCGTTCCPAGYTCSNGTCTSPCPSGETYCPGAGGCCPSFAPVCCGGSLPPGDGECCATGSFCCGNFCCSAGYTCCESGCENPGTTCCPGGVGACPPGFTCCGTGRCCLDGVETCCDGVCLNIIDICGISPVCCPPGYPQGCCGSGTVCCQTGCCTP